MKKKLLILGGTMFTGRMLVEKLLANNQHEVTLFNRGKSNTGIFPSVKQINGNRETDDVLQVANQHWDCVIDFSGYYPLTFEKLLASLNGKVGRYIFISTLSVFDIGKFNGQKIAEEDETLLCSDEQKVSKLPDAYGEKKAEMERLLASQKNMEVIILRPSFIYGQYDWTDRFYYWLYRAKFCDKVLLPPNDFPLSLTYVADLANGILNAIDAPYQGQLYNTISSNGVTLHQVVETAAGLLNRQIELVSSTDAILEKHEAGYSDFPLYVPMPLQIDGSKWLHHFSTIPVTFTDTVKQTLLYCNTVNWALPKAGMSIEKERLIIG